MTGQPSVVVEDSGRKDDETSQDEGVFFVDAPPAEQQTLEAQLRQKESQLKLQALEIQALKQAIEDQTKAREQQMDQDSARQAQEARQMAERSLTVAQEKELKQAADPAYEMPTSHLQVWCLYRAESDWSVSPGLDSFWILHVRSMLRLGELSLTEITSRLCPAMDLDVRRDELVHHLRFSAQRTKAKPSQTPPYPQTSSKMYTSFGSRSFEKPKHGDYRVKIQSENSSSDVSEDVLPLGPLRVDRVYHISHGMNRERDVPYV